MEAPDIVSLADQKSLKRPAAREWIIEMQFVNPAHQRQIAGRDHPRQVIHAAPADPESPVGSPERHRSGRSSLCARQKSGLPERSF
jgi:hypothetical protein